MNLINTSSIKTVFSVLLVVFGIGTVGYGQSSPTNGLVAYYPFNGNANDESGNGHHATVVKAYAAPDRFGRADQAIIFWSSNHIVLPKIEGLDFSNDFSLSLWAYFHLLSGGYLISSGTIETNIVLGVWMDRSGDTRVVFNPSPATSIVQAFTPILPRTWHQFSVVGSNQIVSLYADGILLTNSVADTIAQEDQIWLGSLLGHYIGLSGRLDDIRFYNRALSSAEVKELYDLEGPPFASNERAIDLQCSNLAPGTNYQMEVSLDLATWSQVGEPFTAASATTNFVTEVPLTNTFWKISPLQPATGDGASPELKVFRAIRPSFSKLTVGTTYQLQYSRDAITWRNHGSAFIATDTRLVYPGYVDVENWEYTLFQLKPVP